MTHFIDDFDYEYTGHWFDDLGAGVAMSLQNPVLGYEIASTPGLTREDLNNTLTALQRSSFAPYEES